MKYKTETHIIIDERKLQLLLRLGCNNQIIIDKICGKKISSTGDNLIDETLECFASKKMYNNWGGSRKNAGRKPETRIQVENQVENQVDYKNGNQVVNQVSGQLGTITPTITCLDKKEYNSSLRNTHVKFTPPTLQEVLDYARQQTELVGVGGFSCPQKIAEEFWTHYDSQGWVKSNDSRTPITNWQSSLRSWALKPNKFSKVGNAAPADYDLPL